MTTTRKYEKRLRAENAEQTRRRILDAVAEEFLRDLSPSLAADLFDLTPRQYRSLGLVDNKVGDVTVEVRQNRDCRRCVEQNWDLRLAGGLQNPLNRPKLQFELSDDQIGLGAVAQITFVCESLGFQRGVCSSC